MQSDKTIHLDTSVPLMLISIEGDNVRTEHYSTAARLVASLGLSHHVGVIVPEGAAHRDAFAGALASVCSFDFSCDLGFHLFTLNARQKRKRQK
jgi:hypothetical protein